MRSIDQYYTLAQRELDQLADTLKAQAQSMGKSLEKEPMNRALPCGVADWHAQLRTVERMLTRYTVLCELEIADVANSARIPDGAVVFETFAGEHHRHARKK